MRMPATVGAALAAALGAGCGGGGNLMRLESSAEFNQQVLQSDRPALVDFYKGGCPTCLALEPTLNTLQDEYQDRATFASFEIMKPYFAVTNPELKKKYSIKSYPTVILFLGGQERERWVLDYDIEDYREGLDAALGGAAVEEAAAPAEEPAAAP